MMNTTPKNSDFEEFKLQAELRIITSGLLDPAGRVDPAKITLGAMHISRSIRDVSGDRDPLKPFVCVFDAMLDEQKRIQAGASPQAMEAIVAANPALAWLAVEQWKSDVKCYSYAGGPVFCNAQQVLDRAALVACIEAVRSMLCKADARADMANIVAKIGARLDAERAAELAEKLAAERAAERLLIAPEAVTLDMIVTPGFDFRLPPREGVANFCKIVDDILVELDKVNIEGKAPDDLQMLINANPEMNRLAAQFCDRAAERCIKEGLHANVEAHRVRGHKLLAMAARSAGDRALADMLTEMDTEAMARKKAAVVKRILGEAHRVSRQVCLSGTMQMLPSGSLDKLQSFVHLQPDAFRSAVESLDERIAALQGATLEGQDRKDALTTITEFKNERHMLISVLDRQRARLHAASLT
jgi:hypothetical protein